MAGADTNDSCPIPYLGPEADHQHFLKHHLLPNLPCLFSPHLTSSWPAFHSPFRHPSNLSDPPTLNLPHLLSLQPASTPVSLHHPPPSSSCVDADLSDVLSLWEEGKGHGLYVKDWHLAGMLDKLGEGSAEKQLYQCPGVFADDWLNGWYRSKESRGVEDDFRFVYLGTPCSATLLHRDVYSSYSWSTNISGHKLWRLFPPSHTHLLRSSPRDELISDVRDVDSRIWKGWAEAKEAGIEVLQKEGETIFVPSGWYHQVENLSPPHPSPSPATAHSPIMSINHNWINSTNLRSCHDTLVHDIASCADSISDIREIYLSRKEDGWEAEWVRDVQELVERHSGWGWEGFWKMVEFGVRSSYRNLIVAIENSQPILQPPAHFIVAQVRACLASFAVHPDASSIRPGLSKTFESIDRSLSALEEMDGD